MNLTCSAGGVDGINTAIGCIPVSDTQALVTFLLQWGIGIGGGIALIFIFYAGFIIMTSSGNPQRITAGKELLGASIGGLLLMVFAAFILRIVGQNLLNIPEF